MLTSAKKRRKYLGSQMGSSDSGSVCVWQKVGGNMSNISRGSWKGRVKLIPTKLDIKCIAAEPDNVMKCFCFFCVCLCVIRVCRERKKRKKRKEQTNKRIVHLILLVFLIWLVFLHFQLVQDRVKVCYKGCK